MATARGPRRIGPGRYATSRPLRGEEERDADATADGRADGDEEKGLGLHGIGGFSQEQAPGEVRDSPEKDLPRSNDGRRHGERHQQPVARRSG